MDEKVICKFSFRCDRKWDDLKLIDGKDEVRFCSVCESPVYLTKSYDELGENIAARRCVAIRTSVRLADDLALESPTMDIGLVIPEPLPRKSPPSFDPILTLGIHKFLADESAAKKLKRGKIQLVGDLVQLSSSEPLKGFLLTSPEICAVEEALELRGLNFGMNVENWNKLPRSVRVNACVDDPEDDWYLDNLRNS